VYPSLLMSIPELLITHSDKVMSGAASIDDLRLTIED
jgi:hypothetical protein